MRQAVELKLVPCQSSAADGESLLDEYVELLSAPLLGAIPYADRARLRQETIFHLERLRDDFVAKGSTRDIAMQEAIRSYGPPFENGERFLESWFKKKQTGFLSQALGHANAIAFSAFGVAQAACVVIYQMRVFLPGDSVFRYAVNPAALKELVSPAIPIPELTPLYGLAAFFSVLGPIIAGAIVGCRVPVRPAVACYHATIVCILYSMLMGLLLLPMKEMLLFSAFQVSFWIPAGMVSATVFGAVTRQTRLRRRPW